MYAKSLSAPWIIRLTWYELGTLLVCLGLDFVEYVFPMLQAPLIGDILDIAGVAFSLFFLRWIGAISLLEIIPGFDVLPVYTATWLIWYLFKKRGDTRYAENLLDRWR